MKIRLVVDLCFTVTGALLLQGCADPYPQFPVFVREVKAAVQPEELRAWAVQVMKGRAPGDFIDEREVLDAMKGIGGKGPHSVFVARTEGGRNNAVDLCWGSGFGHWGLIVGEMDFVITSDDPKHRVTAWVPGIYFYRER